MAVFMLQPAIDPDSLLSGAQFIDAFGIALPHAGLTARTAAERMFNRSPRWIRLLSELRDLVVAPFGLTTTMAARRADTDRVGMFPVISETPQRLVAGFDDHHLDFRVVVDVAAAGAGQHVTLTTVVLMHNRLGRAYLTTIKPFHRLVARAMLRQLTAGEPARAPDRRS